MPDDKSPAKPSARNGVLVSLGFGATYAAIVFFTLASRAYDLDFIFSLYAMPLVFVAFVIGVVAAWSLYSVFAWFKMRKFQMRLSTQILLILLLAALLAPSFIPYRGSDSEYGRSDW